MLSSYTILAFVLGFLVAQTWKAVSDLARNGKKGDVAQVKDFFSAVGYFARSGGMPSGHMASFTAAVVYLGCVYGFGSGLFMLGACVWTIVLYDAIHVRYAVGEQGKALNEILKKAGKKALPVVEGHTLAQAAVGAIIGVVVGAGLFLIVKGGF